MLDDGLTIWRYFTPEKFESLVKLRALWMCRLGHLQDQYEGRMPVPTAASVGAQTEEMIKSHEHLFPPGVVRSQLGNEVERNMRDGRSMTMVSCWFLGDGESERMWREYGADPRSVAIRSTIGRLRRSIKVWYPFTTLDQVRYVDFQTHDMGAYEGSSAMARAFLKDLRFEHESEVRLIALNDVGEGSLNEDGTPPSLKQLQGPGRYDPHRRGQFLEVRLETLIDRVVTSPRASAADQRAVLEACVKSGIASPIEASALRATA